MALANNQLGLAELMVSLGSTMSGHTILTRIPGPNSNALDIFRQLAKGMRQLWLAT